MGENPLALVGDELVFESHGMVGIGSEQLKMISDIECKNCGTTHHDITTTGCFGCEKCYVVFGDLLNIADAHIEHSIQDRKSLHVTYSDTVSNGKIEVLKRQMEKAIAAENYEKAAKIRDDLEKLKAEKNGEKAPIRKD